MKKIIAPGVALATRPFVVVVEASTGFVNGEILIVDRNDKEVCGRKRNISNKALWYKKFDGIMKATKYAIEITSKNTLQKK